MNFWGRLFVTIFSFFTLAAFADAKSFYFSKRFQTVPVTDADSIASGTFQQKVDHTTAEDERTFSQRYYYNTDYASDVNAPVLFYLCGESTCEPSSLKGAIESHAKALKANLVSLEHRYYGKSQPFDRLSTENLKFLTIEQALADARAFQKIITEKLGLSGKWIAVGGSYPGSLAAYYRLKYPDAVVGALSSSGPVMAKEDFFEYDLHVSAVAGPDCLARIKTAVAEVERAITDPKTALETRKLFQAEKLEDDVDFLYLVADMAALAVQYGYRDRFCSLLATKGPLEGYAEFTRQIFESWGMNALSGSAAGATSEDPNEYLSVFGMRQWLYQSCTEYGYWQNAFHDEKISARSSRINLDYHRNICKRLFGLETPVDEKTTNEKYYLPLFESGVSQILFTNGSRDPWSKLSVTTENGNNTNAALTVMTLQDAAHCDDLRSPKGTDLPSVKSAREKFLELAQKWLK